MSDYEVSYDTRSIFTNTIFKFNSIYLKLNFSEELLVLVIISIQVKDGLIKVFKETS